MSAAPALFALLLWFASTAAIVWLDSLPRRTFRASFSGLGLLACVAIAAIVATRSGTSASAAYIGFASAIAIWGWQEFGFLSGIVAGPRRLPLSPGATGWRRFREATAAVIHHEVALAVTLTLIVALTWSQPNQAAAWTFAILFALRLSAKLNLFLGVPNLSDEVFPAHLAHLKSYFAVRRLNALMPVSLLLAAGLAAAAWYAGNGAAVGSGLHVASRAATMLAVLGLVEHLFLVLPLRDGALWTWAAAKTAEGRG